MRKNRGDTIPVDLDPRPEHASRPLLDHPGSFAATPARGRLLRVLAWVFMGALVVVVGMLYVPMPPNPDHELYDYMAWSARHEGPLYRNAGDVNMPGAALRHIVAMTIFGNHFWSYRMFDYIALVAFTAVIGLLCRRYCGNLYAYIFLAFYPVVYTTSGYWTTGQRDVLATHGIVLAGFAYLRRVEGGGIAWLIVAGAAMAEAVLLKPTYLAFGPFLLAAVAVFVRQSLKRHLIDAVIVAASGAFVLGSVVALGWATDALRDWYEMTVLYSAQNYMGGLGIHEILKEVASTVIQSWHWFAVMALSGLLCWLFERQKTPLSVIFAVLATVIVSTLVQRKGFGYHFGGMLVVISLLSAFYLAEIVRLARRIPDARLRYSVLSFPLLIAVCGLLSKSQRELLPQAQWYLDRSHVAAMHHGRSFEGVLEAANYARSATSPGDTIWTYSSHMMINSLAGRPMPARFANYALLRATRVSPLEERWRQEVETVFRDRPPAFIVLEQLKRADPEIFFNMHAIRPDEPISALKSALDRDYVLDRWIGRFAFFRRAARPDAAAKVGARDD
jgi:hypothetical protein